MKVQQAYSTDTPNTDMGAEAVWLATKAITQATNQIPFDAIQGPPVLTVVIREGRHGLQAHCRAKVTMHYNSFVSQRMADD